MKYEHRYKHGKIMKPIEFGEFEAALRHPYNTDLHYQAFIVLLYYTGVRVSEALRAIKEDFSAERATLYWDVGVRLKTRRKRKDGTIYEGKRTKPLPLDLSQPHMDLLLEQISRSKKGEKIFDFDRTTAWRHVKKGGLGYNHLARLSALTFFLKNGYSIAEIVNWFGVSVQTVNSYIGDLSLEKMGSTRRR